MHYNLKVYRKNHRYSYEKICQTVKVKQKRDQFLQTRGCTWAGERLVQGLGHSPGRKSIYLPVYKLYVPNTEAG